MINKELNRRYRKVEIFNQNMIRVLHCNNDNKNIGGAYLVTRKLDTYMRNYGYIFDYLTMDEFVIRKDEKLNPKRDSITFSARLRHNRFIGHIKLAFYMEKILRKNSYQIVHIDIDSAWKALLYAIPAKRSGARVIIHSHSSGIDGEHRKIKEILHYFCKHILPKYSDKYIGCSYKALTWVCPSNRLHQGEVLLNGIDENEYFFDKDLRSKTRKELKIDNCLVLCNVGRINDNKNQIFLVDVLKELKKMISSAVLILVGEYREYDYEKIKKRIKSNNLENSVIIVGETYQVNKYLNASDFFVSSSIHEGLSLACIEAQRVGLKCLLSSGNSPETKVTELAMIKAVDIGSKEWAKIIYMESARIKDRRSMKIAGGNTLEGMSLHLSSVYSNLIRG